MPGERAWRIAKLGVYNCYWSNDMGWVDRASADLFTWRETRAFFDLPVGGVWTRT